MAGNARFHNKWHRKDHHSRPTPGFPSSATDPIASKEEPFVGDMVLVNSLCARENLKIDGNATIVGNLSVLGDLTYLDTIVSVTSALSVVNTGTGPAVTVMQYGAQPIARFIDADGPGGLSAYALSLEDTGQAVFSGTYPSLDRRVSIYGTLSAAGNTEFQGGSASGNRNLAANSSRAFGSDTAAFGKSLATGNYSFAEGHITTAAGAASHVEGINNTVNVGTSAGHAEGFNNTAAANYAHAEGTGTSAGGVASHAEGISNTASASGAHAEGTGTTASKPFAHAEGQTTTASGSGAHAEGFQTTASGNYSHAEGGFAQALSLYAHAEGNSTTAAGAHSHAEGSGSAANNTNSHAEGSTTTANGAAAHAEGSNTTADGTSSHAEGSGTQAVSTGSHAEGVGCVATGEGSHAEGIGITFTNGAGAHAEGGNTSAIASCAHSEGLATVASAAAAHAEGILTQAAASGAHTGGYATSASGIYSFAHGRFAQATKQDSISLGFSARAVHDDSFVFSSKSGNVYSSTSFANDTFNVYATGGIELFDPVTVGDPVSAVTFIVTTSGTVGVNIYNPLEALSVVGNISASGSLSAIGAAPNYFVGSVGIGLSANKPTALLTVLSGFSAINPDNVFGTTMHSSNDGGINRLVFDSFNGQYAVFTGRAARGSSLVPAAVQNKDLLSQFTARGRAVTAYPNASNARMNMYAGQNFTDTAYGTFINFEVTAPGTTVATPIAQLSSTGLAIFGQLSATGLITTSDGISAVGGLSAATIKIGSPGINLPNAVGQFFQNTTSYSQVNQQNTNAGNAASTDFVATADNGNDTTNFIDMGINSSTYNDAAFTISGPDDGYLYANGGKLILGTATNKDVVLHTGNTLAANERMRILGDGSMVTVSSNLSVAATISASNIYARIQANFTAVSAVTLTAQDVSIYGTLSSGAGILANSLSSRFITLVHTPANDGTNAKLDIGEFDTATAGNLGFSGFSVEYNEINNKLVTRSTFAGSTTLTATAMDRFGTIEQPNGWYISSVSQVSAGGINQATATPIYTVITTVTGSGVGLGGLLLPPTNGGHIVYLYNFSGNNVTIYPQTGGRIYPAATNGGFALANNTYLPFQSLSANFWSTIL